MELIFVYMFQSIFTDVFWDSVLFSSYLKVENNAHFKVLCELNETVW